MGPAQGSPQENRQLPGCHGSLQMGGRTASCVSQNTRCLCWLFPILESPCPPCPSASAGNLPVSCSHPRAPGLPAVQPQVQLPTCSGLWTTLPHTWPQGSRQPIWIPAPSLQAGLSLNGSLTHGSLDTCSVHSQNISQEYKGSPPCPDSSPRWAVCVGLPSPPHSLTHSVPSYLFPSVCQLGLEARLLCVQAAVHMLPRLLDILLAFGGRLTE